MDPLLGQIILWPLNWVPQGWMACEGQPLSIAQYTALYSLLGTTYGGDGKTNFNLPNLINRFPLHTGGPSAITAGSAEVNYVATGTGAVLLSPTQLPSHTHTATFTSSTPTSTTVSVAIPANATTNNPVNTPGTTTVMAKGTTGSDPASVYTTEAASTTLKPFDTTVNLPTVQGSVRVASSSSGSPQLPVNLAVAVPLKFSTMPPIMAMRYIIAVDGIYPTRP